MEALAAIAIIVGVRGGVQPEAGLRIGHGSKVGHTHVDWAIFAGISCLG